MGGVKHEQVMRLVREVVVVSKPMNWAVWEEMIPHPDVNRDYSDLVTHQW